MRPRISILDSHVVDVAIRKETSSASKYRKGRLYPRPLRTWLDVCIVAVVRLNRVLLALLSEPKHREGPTKAIAITVVRMS